MSLVVHLKKTHPDSKIPTYAHEGDAGFDLYSTEKITVEPHARVQVPTGIAMQIPQGHVGLIWDKSGLSHKGGLKTLGGVIDSGYRGEVFVGIINLSNISYTFEKGHKIAQMIIQKYETPELVEVNELGEGVRAANGFGSSGK